MWRFVFLTDLHIQEKLRNGLKDVFKTQFMLRVFVSDLKIVSNMTKINHDDYNESRSFNYEACQFNLKLRYQHLGTALKKKNG